MNSVAYPQKLFIDWRKGAKPMSLNQKKIKNFTTKDNLFVQFMRRNKHNEVEMMNGFSHVHDQCKNIGDFYWTYFIPEKAQESILPISKGTVYVSAFYAPHIYQSLLWARNQPNVKFVVGGPALITSSFNPIDFPKNWEARLGLAEDDIFNGIKPGLKWNLEMPKVQKVPDDLVCSYTINRSCSWKKCIFCARSEHEENSSFENTIDNLKLPPGKNWSVWLLTPTVRPSFMKQLHLLPTEGIRHYIMFIRSDKLSCTELNKALAKCSPELRSKFVFRLGIEFPTDRMLRIMKKGTTAYWQLETMKMLKSYKCNMKLCFILGWNILTQNDVDNVASFVDQMGIEGINPTITVFYLVVNYSSEKSLLRKVNKAKTRILIHEFNDIYKYHIEIPILTPKQLELNRAVRNIYKNYFIDYGEAMTTQEILGEEGDEIIPSPYY